ncbi:hypothetical protein KFU94_40520 [Chloroflexi bacterium TSY]|nr:hypothetical protein [Chloroflexi bacterium TSY]
MAHIQSLSRPDVAEAIAGLEPLSDVVMFNVPKTRWHHYEKLTHFLPAIWCWVMPSAP